MVEPRVLGILHAIQQLESPPPIIASMACCLREQVHCTVSTERPMGFTRPRTWETGHQPGRVSL